MIAISYDAFLYMRRASSSKWQWQCGNMATRPWTPHIWANFLYSAVSSDMISCLAREASRVVPSISKDDFSKRDSNSTLDQRPSDIPPLAQFISHIVVQSKVQVPTLMTTLVYLARLRSKIPPTASSRYCTAHRIFLACLILSSKFVNDLSPKNRKWAIYSQTENFSLDIIEVNLMERQLLSLLKW